MKRRSKLNFMKRRPRETFVRWFAVENMSSLIWVRRTEMWWFHKVYLNDVETRDLKIIWPEITVSTMMESGNVMNTFDDELKARKARAIMPMMTRKFEIDLFCFSAEGKEKIWRRKVKMFFSLKTWPSEKKRSSKLFLLIDEFIQSGVHSTGRLWPRARCFSSVSFCCSFLFCSLNEVCFIVGLLFVVVSLKQNRTSFR